MATPRDLIKGSLRLIGAIATGEAPSADEQTDAFNVLNDMLDSWSNEKLTIFQTTTETFPLTIGQQTYSMGPTGNFNTVRPQKIENIGIQQVSSANLLELPMKILNQDQWANITIKATTSALPLKVYIEDTYPLLTLYFWPVPSAAVNIVLYSWKPLGSFATVNSVISLPPGYAKALRYNLAMELAPEYGKEPSQVVAMGAAESKENIKRMNVKPLYLGVDSGAVARKKSFNWLTGE